MAQEERSGTESRKKRVQRLKKMIVTVLITGVTVPPILCLILFLITGSLRREMRRERQEYEMKLETMEEQLAEQKSLIEKLTEMVSQVGQRQEEPPKQEEAEQQTEPLQEESEQQKEAGQQKEVGQQEELQEKDEGLTAAHRVYLTFDDGPSSNTNEILDILKTYDVRATFFIVGTSGKADVAALQRIVDEGHSLGMHSYSHRYAEIYSGLDSFVSDFQAIHSFLYEATGVDSRLYRFPGGSSNTVTGMDIQECISYLTDQGVTYFDWNVSSGDATREALSADTIYSNCIAGIEKRSSTVILLHDAAGKKTTVEALPRVIEAILGMEDTAILPLTADSELVQHVKLKVKEEQ